MTTRKTLTLASGALVAGLFSVTASAAWDGLYLGATFGWVDADERWTSDENDDPVTATDDGSALGFLWGYNHQQDQLVIGVEADIAVHSASPDANDWGSAEIVSTDLESVAHFRTRVGYLLGENFLPYVSLGVAVARTDTRFIDDGFSSDQEQFDSVRAGLSYGFGLEWAASDRLHARLEFVRDEYSSESFGSYNVLGDSAFGKLETESFTLGLLYTF
jgi:outer membrane immunogenic protein